MSVLDSHLQILVYMLDQDLKISVKGFFLIDILCMWTAKTLMRMAIAQPYWAFAVCMYFLGNILGVTAPVCFCCHIFSPACLGQPSL